MSNNNHNNNDTNDEANNDSIEAEDIFASSPNNHVGNEESKLPDENNIEAAAAAAAAAVAMEEDDPVDDEILAMSTAELRQRITLLDNDIRIMRSDIQRITHESHGQRERIRDNQEKVKMNKQLPYLVGNVVEVLEPDAEDGKVLNRIGLLSKFMSHTEAFCL